MSARDVKVTTENALLIVSYCEEQGWLHVAADGKTGATEAGIAWLEERDRALGYEIEWSDDASLQTQNRILVHASYLLAVESPIMEPDEAMFRLALDNLRATPSALSHSVSYNGGMEEAI